MSHGFRDIPENEWAPWGEEAAHKRRKEKKSNGASGGADWLFDCIKENNKPLPVLANALIGLRAGWNATFAYDEMLCAPMLMKPIEPNNTFLPRPVTDVDVGLLQERLQHCGLRRVAKDTVHQAVDIVAYEHRFGIAAPMKASTKIRS